MLTKKILLAALLLSITAGSADRAIAQYQEAGVIQSATAVFNETMSLQRSRIPKAMLQNSHGVAIIPNVIKGGFVIGARFGRGVLFVRKPDGSWHAPVFITLTGGNIGWQAGVQSSDVVLVFKTQKSVQGILSGKLTIGADAAAAAGPVGREASAATDGRLQAEIYSYAKTRGLFVGVSIDGSVVKVDQFATGAYYGNPAPGQPVNVPPAALSLTQSIATASGGGPAAVPIATAQSQPAAAPIQIATPAVQHSISEVDLLRSQLVQLAPELYEILDDQWKAYLGLPSSLFLGSDPTPADLQKSVRNFQVVATNPEFQQLAERPEFRSVNGILLHYQQALVSPSGSIQLPPPPTFNQASFQK